MIITFEHFVGGAVVFVPLFGYIVRLEIRLAKIKSDLCWIKKTLEKLQP